jgi:hypothetical protein
MWRDRIGSLNLRIPYHAMIEYLHGAKSDTNLDDHLGTIASVSYS